MESVADQVRQLLANAGLSQRAGARELGIEERTMRRYCSDDLPVPRFVVLSLQSLAAEALIDRADASSPTSRDELLAKISKLMEAANIMSEARPSLAPISKEKAIITKLDAANRQLVAAIRLYFHNDDLAAIHTLACAAREIFEKHCASQGIERMFEKIQAGNPERSTKDLWAILNGPRNFLKHPEASMDLSAAIELDDEMNATMLWVACHDCAMLCKDAQPPEVQAYTAWFMATRFPEAGTDEDPEAARAADIIGSIRTAYPGLHEASLQEQKRIGRTMMQDARGVVSAA